MKNALRICALVLLSVAIASACGSDDAVSINDSAAGQRVATLWVEPDLVDCVGAFPQECMQVRYSQDGEVEWFYDEIEGFEHVAGTSYVLKVGVTDVENPPADHSSLSYQLIEVVESSK